MTVVAIWRGDGGFLWAAADTRITVEGSGGGRTIRTDAASKLLALPVVCMPIRQMPGTKYVPHWQGRFGFAFAGDTLPAMMTYATAIAILSDLQSNNTDPPSLRDIADALKKLGTRFGRDAAQGRNQSKLPFEAAVFGWCPSLRDYAVYALRPGIDDPLQLKIEEIRPHPTGPIVVLGSGGAELIGEVDKLRGHSSVALGSLPRGVLAKMVADAGHAEEVGGSVSYGRANAGNFELALRAEVTPEGPIGYVTFNNINVAEEIGSLGGYRIGMLAVR